VPILELIENETRVPAAQLLLIVRSANHRYKSYDIPKRSGGLRTIEHPARELKFLQRWMAENIFARAPIHPCATAYRRGFNVRRNAEVHTASRYYLKLDFENFFSSILLSDVTSLVRNCANALPFILSEDDVSIIGATVTRRGRLVIGAPSSPIISNAALYNLDNVLCALGEAESCVYSRYADDIVFSTQTPNSLAQVLTECRHAIDSNGSPRLRINEKKVVFTSKKRRVRVTGLVISSEGRISVGRAVKRRIRAQIYQYRLGNLSPEDGSYLSGYLAYTKTVEPSFITALERKYTTEVIMEIQRLPKIMRKS
jgi:RNA-directed DNA polymerase